MKQEEYLVLSERTLSKNFYCTNPDDQVLLHAAMGLQTEVGELFSAYNQARKSLKLNVVNFMEEIGDSLWYCAIVRRMFPSLFPDWNPGIAHDDLVGSLFGLNDASCNLLDLMKKRIYYGKVSNTFAIDVTNTVVTAEYQLWNLAKGLGYELEGIRVANIAKLAKRYGDKFDDFLADNRDLAAETVLLDKHFAPTVNGTRLK